MESLASRKLLGIPKIFIMSLPTSVERIHRIKTQMERYRLENFEFVYGESSIDRNEQIVQNSILRSHLKCNMAFLADPSLEWAIIAEDDLDFKLVEYWPFNFEDKFDELKRQNIEIFQMCIIYEASEDFNPKLHPRIENIDWSAGAYLLSRRGAQLILDKEVDWSLCVEQNLFDGLPVFSEPILTCHTGDATSLHYHHNEFHSMSFRLAELSMRELSAQQEN